MTVTVLANHGDAEFHRGWATWGALADICWAVAPEICAACKLWDTNDGDGLDADGSIRLADVLEARLLDGTVEKLINDKAAYASSLPDEVCKFCGGSGVRIDARGVELGFDKRLIEEPGHPRHGQQGWCNGRSGRGFLRPYQAFYPLEDDGKSTVEELISFLRASGGFRIC